MDFQNMTISYWMPRWLRRLQQKGDVYMIRENIQYTMERIQEACDHSDRTVQEITLVAVSKTKPVSMIQEALEGGTLDFGENKVQELVDKYEQLPNDIRWHLIGHLQRNKVKYIVDKVFLIHSVDSLRLAEEISREAVKKQVTVFILIQVNIAGEDSKFGLATEEIVSVIEQISKLPNIRIKGLMTIAPFVDNPEENRTHFKNMKKLFVDIRSKNIDNVDMEILSMGMTGDYEVAIEEGATMVRVGTGIFGERHYVQ